MSGVKLIFKSPDGLIFGLKNIGSDDGFNLPSITVRGGNDPRESAKVLFKSLTGENPLHDPLPAYRGRDEEYGISHSYLTGWRGDFKFKEDQEGGWRSIQDILCGRWGLFARDVFNRLGLMNRPKLDYDRLYKISKKALDDGSQYAADGVDLVIDEVNFLLDIGKPGGVDDILRELELTKLHADIISSLQAVVEEVPLPSKDDFNIRANSIIQEIDSLRKKYKLIGVDGQIISRDVRGDALKYYRKKAQEFGKKLRDGTLAQEFPGLHRGGSTPIQRNRKPGDPVS